MHPYGDTSSIYGNRPEFDEDWEPPTREAVAESEAVARMRASEIEHDIRGKLRRAPGLAIWKGDYCLLYLPSRRKRYYLKQNGPMIYKAKKARACLGQLCPRMKHVGKSLPESDEPPGLDPLLHPEGDSSVLPSAGASCVSAGSGAERGRPLPVVLASSTVIDHAIPVSEKISPMSSMVVDQRRMPLRCPPGDVVRPQT